MDLDQDSSAAVSDPFALMMNPEAVLRAVERSERLARLQRRVCRPLDKPLPGHSLAERLAAEFDALVDSQSEDDPTFE